MIFQFENMELDTDRFELRVEGQVRKLEPQVYALIELLVTNHHRVVTLDEINQVVWGGRVVSDAVISSRIRSARKALGDSGAEQRLIRTLHSRGFSFAVAPTTRRELIVAPTIAGPSPDAPPERGEDQDPDTPRSERPSIAVLPFTQLCDNPRYDNLADAVAHDLIADLSRLRWLFVIARGSSFRFRGPDVDLADVGRVLNVRYVITGSLTLTGGRCAAVVELSHTGDGHVVWADRLEGTIDDMMGFRETILHRVTSALEIRVTEEEARRAAVRPEENLDAWAAYHRGLWHMLRFNRHDNEIAARMFRRAMEEDQRFARAHAGLAFTHFQTAFVGYGNNVERDRELTRKLAEKSLELDPMDPLCNLVMGRSHWLEGDLDNAISWLQRGIDLCPNHAQSVYTRGLLQAISCRPEEGEKSANLAMNLSPVDPLLYGMLGTHAVADMVRGDYASARDWAEQSMRAPGAHIQNAVIAALANQLDGNEREAQAWARRILDQDPTFSQDRFFKAFPFTDPDFTALASNTLRKLSI